MVAMREAMRMPPAVCPIKHLNHKQNKHRRKPFPRSKALGIAWARRLQAAKGHQQVAGRHEAGRGPAKEGAQASRPCQHQASSRAARQSLSC